MDEPLSDASRLCAAFLDAAGYGVAYGSHADGAAGPDSDLDLLYVTSDPLDATRSNRLVEEVVVLHERHGLALDEEVAYGVKLHATMTEVQDSLALRGFTIRPDGSLSVPPVVAEEWFLNSTQFKLRLILNALTTPHVFLGGSVDHYQHHRASAARGVALLALSLLEAKPVITVSDTSRALLSDANGVGGRDFLGYTYAPDLHAVLQRGLARLSHEGAVRPIDRERFEQDHDRRRSLIIDSLCQEPTARVPDR